MKQDRDGGEMPICVQFNEPLVDVKWCVCLEGAEGGGAPSFCKRWCHLLNMFILHVCSHMPSAWRGLYKQKVKVSRSNWTLLVITRFHRHRRVCDIILYSLYYGRHLQKSPRRLLWGSLWPRRDLRPALHPSAAEAWSCSRPPAFSSGLWWGGDDEKDFKVYLMPSDWSVQSTIIFLHLSVQFQCYIFVIFKNNPFPHVNTVVLHCGD